MNLQPLKTKYYVGLGSTSALWKWETFSDNEKIEEMSKPNGLVYFEVKSLKEASVLVRKFITQFNLGASNWTGGIVLDSEQKIVAKVSYNGRVWDNLDWNTAKEIKIC
jgi:hypothetical protein